MPLLISLVGREFERLTVFKRIKVKESRRTHWECRCSCGGSVISTSDNLTSGNTKSCGCIRLETPNHLTHGERHSRFYNIYCGIKKRCENEKEPSYKNYGGRGIRCRWRCFEMFRDDMRRSYDRHVARHGERNTSIERVNNDGHYQKENCRWATRREQSLNSRSNVLLTHKGETMTMKEWADRIGMRYHTLKHRIRLYGWTTERALTTPVGP